MGAEPDKDSNAENTASKGSKLPIDIQNTQLLKRIKNTFQGKNLKKKKKKFIIISQYL